MKTIKGLGFLLAATSVLVSAAPAFAATVDGQNKNTNGEVKITDNVDPSSTTLKLEKVPEGFKFQTKLNDSGTYSITTGANANDSAKTYQVFSDTQGANWAVKSTVDPQLKSGSKTVDVSGLEINGKQFKGGGVIMDSTANQVGTNGYSNVDVSSMKIDFTGSNVAVGDTYTGNINNVLYNTVSAD